MPSCSDPHRTCVSAVGGSRFRALLACSRTTRSRLFAAEGGRGRLLRPSFVVSRMGCRLTNEERQMAKNTICLWYDGTAEEAARFYAQTFPNSAVTMVHRAPGDYPDGKQGQVLTVEFTVLGVACLGLNGGPAFKHSEAFSFQIVTEDQTETDRYWNAIVDNGGAESQCGWCKDRWGLSWQITPRVLLEAITSRDQAAAKRAFDAMMGMKKIDIAAIEAARRSQGALRAR